tara:strand:- start:954 stop:1175 length:222 start_codon:yes stop_codon:yes gene_type:complete
MRREKKLNEFDIEAKTSGGAVFELGVKTSKESTAIRRLAEPLMNKHWKGQVTNLHRIYKVAAYLLKRSKRLDK